MFSKVSSGAVCGVEGYLVNVEADVCDGLPLFSMVGYLASEVKEAKERVRISIKNLGYRLPPKHITINLAPANKRKEGTAFDLPIAIAVLVSFGYIDQKDLKDTLIIGELSLDGQVRKVNGVLPIVYEAKKSGYTRCVVPYFNRNEAAAIEEIQVIAVKTLKEAVDFFQGNFIPEDNMGGDTARKKEKKQKLDFNEVTGQEGLKRAIEVAVSGMHNLLMIGPPGVGKTMLARRIPTIMPELSFEESIEVSKVYSVAGMLEEDSTLINERPFRAPHHTITNTALVGGGNFPKPGEISLATGGVLLLDELAEFNKSTLELLRQPLEDRYVTVARLNGTYKYPANTILCATMNPCNCGYYPDMRRCTCNITQIKRYLGKISRPLLNRIDLCAEAVEITYKEFGDRHGESSSQIRERVIMARERQTRRYQKEPIQYNGQLTPGLLKKYAPLSEEVNLFLEEVFQKMHLNVRSYHRVVKVARTIADLDGKENIECKHVSEAVFYRSLDNKYWV